MGSARHGVESGPAVLCSQGGNGAPVQEGVVEGRSMGGEGAGWVEELGCRGRLEIPSWGILCFRKRMKHVNDSFGGAMVTVRRQGGFHAFPVWVIHTCPTPTTLQCAIP